MSSFLESSYFSHIIQIINQLNHAPTFQNPLSLPLTSQCPHSLLAPITPHHLSQMMHHQFKRDRLSHDMVRKSFYSLPWTGIVACEEGGVLEEAPCTHDPVDAC